MPTPLDRLLDAIHPARTHDVVQRHVDETINSFRIVSNIVTDAIEYHDIVCRFTHRLDSRLGLLPADMPVANSVLWERASRLLRESYGPRGEIAAYEIQRVGAEAGLLGILRRMASQAAEERIEADVDAWVTAFCDRLSADEYLAVGEEYICETLKERGSPSILVGPTLWTIRVSIRDGKVADVKVGTATPGP